MLELKLVQLDSDYSKKWNNNLEDFLHLYKDGVKVCDTLYRKGGIGGDLKDGYILMLKHIEAHYDDSITEDKDRKPHLENQWCIIDKNGVEKVNFNEFDSPYLTGGIVYSLKNHYYNIETGELYCQSYDTMKSEEFIFLNNAYDDDKSKRGIMKINKIDGTYELFKKI